ncbi:hypothetical protein [Streptomyces sp. NPDC058855]|uniref:hypothetical protein n=1 Tax=Streptomyces sp. NPDC058855 TaxID=3346651 RepID=UPI0036917790
MPGPWLGLPPLPVVDWPEEDGDGDWDGGSGDGEGEGQGEVGGEVAAADREWVAAHHPAPALLHRVDHRCGLIAADFAALEEWVRWARGCGG